MPETIEDKYAAKRARSRRRHGRPFKAQELVPRLTPPSMLLKVIAERVEANAKNAKPETTAGAAAPQLRRVGGGKS